MKLKWDQVGERYFQTGVDRGVLYEYKELEYTNGVPWNGLSSMRIGPTGSTAYDGKLYRKNIKTDIVQSFNEYNGKITCYTYPDEFEKCLGYTELIPGIFASQQEKPLFGVSFRTGLGNDIEGIGRDYRIHLVYNCIVVTSDSETRSIGDEANPDELIYDLETFPVESDLLENPSSEIILDSRKLTKTQLDTIETILYGSENTEARMPYPDELVEILSEELPDDRLYPELDLHPDTELYPID